jgi:hypothetical protein
VIVPTQNCGVCEAKGAYADRVKARLWLTATGTAIGSAGVLVLYLAIIASQGDNGPAAWAVAILVLGAVLPFVGIAVPRVRSICFAVPATLLTVLSILAALSIGIFIVPFAFLAWLGFASSTSASGAKSVTASR